MQAMVIDHYGSANNFRWAEITTPKPKPHEVLIKIQATSVNPLDWRIRSGSLKYLLPLRFPLILGFDFCGQIVKLGEKVTAWKVGQSVFGISNHLSGQCYAEYIAIPEKYLVEKPDNLSAEEAASVPVSASTAFLALQHASRATPGKTVLINGASGGVGHFAVQIAHYLGATVTAVCSQKNRAFIESLGANEIINYQEEPVLVKKFDIIFDVVGNLPPKQVLRYLQPQGVGVSIVPTFNRFLFQAFSYFTTHRYKNVFVYPNKDVLSFLAKLIKQKKLAPFVQEVLPLARIAEAHALIEAKHVKGKLAILVE